MKVKTADLLDAPLDWAVAQCKGFKKIRAMPAWSNKHGAHGGPQVMVSNEEDSSFDYRPSTNWSQGGPIVDREGIYFGPLPDKGIRAYRFIDGECCNIMDCWGASITRCVVAMRCFVASRFGDEVDIPDELL